MQHIPASVLMKTLFGLREEGYIYPSAPQDRFVPDSNPGANTKFVFNFLMFNGCFNKNRLQGTLVLPNSDVQYDKTMNYDTVDHLCTRFVAYHPNFSPTYFKQGIQDYLITF